MSVKWAKSVPSFLSLPTTDQTLLLEESWAQLFLLNISQWSINIDEGIDYDWCCSLMNSKFLNDLQISSA